MSRFPVVLVTKLFGPMIARQQGMRSSQFDVLPPPDADVVFLGDSITEFGLWNEWFPDVSVANRGVAGDTTAGILRRLHSSVGTQRALSLLAGTNDIAQGVPSERIAANVDTILERIAVAAPETKVVINSVMPRAAGFSDTVRDVNDKLRLIATKHGATYVDLWPAFADERGQIRPEFSLDRLHLTGEGYRAWVGVLADHVR